MCGTHPRVHIPRRLLVECQNGNYSRKHLSRHLKPEAQTEQYFNFGRALVNWVIQIHWASLNQNARCRSTPNNMSHLRHLDQRRKLSGINERAKIVPDDLLAEAASTFESDCKDCCGPQICLVSRRCRALIAVKTRVLVDLY
jgi:hypothetical protein